MINRQGTNFWYPKPNDVELAALQNEIVAVCTRNMQRKYELNLLNLRQEQDALQEEISKAVLNVNSSTSTLSSSSSSSSSTRPLEDIHTSIDQENRKRTSAIEGYKSSHSRDGSELSIVSCMMMKFAGDTYIDCYIE